MVVRILQLEDDEETASGLSEAGSNLIWQWDCVSSLEAASQGARQHRYDLFLVDLEVYERGVRQIGAGSRFIKQLASRALGDLNAETPVIVHTAHLEEYKTAKLGEVSTVVRIVQKPEDPTEEMLRAIYRNAMDRVLVEVLPLSESERDGQALVRLPGWKPAAFYVSLAHFEESSLDHLVVAEEVVFFSGYADLSAEAADGLALHSLRLLRNGGDLDDLWSS